MAFSLLTPLPSLLFALSYRTSRWGCGCAARSLCNRPETGPIPNPLPNYAIPKSHLKSVNLCATFAQWQLSELLPTLSGPVFIL